MDKNFYKVQYGIIMSRNSELEKKVLKLTMENAEMSDRLIELGENFRRLDRLHRFGTPTDGLEVGGPEDYEVDNQLNLFDDK